MPDSDTLSAAAPRYFNRELSWLAFNRRVLEQAGNDKFPLLERMRFLSFVSSNLDEFFEIRVAGLLQQAELGGGETGADGLTPGQALHRIQEESYRLVRDQYQCLHGEILTQLGAEGIEFITRQEVTPDEHAWLEGYFARELYKRLIPMAVDPAHPFPHIYNKQLNILLGLQPLDDSGAPEGDETLMAIIPVPRGLSRVLQIGSATTGRGRHIFLSDVVKLFADQLFPGYRITGAWAFRLTRNSNLYIDEEEVTLLLKKIEQQMLSRRKGAAVRLEIEETADPALLARLVSETAVPEDFVVRVPGPINPARLFSVYDDIARPDLKFRPFTPVTPPALQNPERIFETIAAGDVLLHHPYDSYAPIVSFLEQAADDPQVLTIQQTLYRTSSDSPIAKALMRACENGKQVSALVELKARFDEENNMKWAEELQEAGVHVVYGLVGLKTHCKCCLVIRQEPGGVRCYAHLGTGNYNPKTARLYTDLSLFTAREEATSEVVRLFHTLTGFARAPKFDHLLVAPYGMLDGFLRLIATEAANARHGHPARITAKVNSLIDQDIIDALYDASCAGVKIELIVRGICGLVPGVPGQSENIRVRSLLGRYLEHSRIFYFENATGPAPLLLAGSADWMPRNLRRRVEAVFPITDPRLRDRVLNEILPPYAQDTAFATELGSDGTYTPVRPAIADEKPFSAQQYFVKLAEKA